MDVTYEFHLDRAGVAALMTAPETGAVVDAAAEQIAATTRTLIGDPDIDVVVDHYTTDRRAAAVVIADHGGLPLQARHGVLTRAAAQAGLDVRATT